MMLAIHPEVLIVDGSSRNDRTAADHPYHGANCSEGWGDGTAAASATVTVDGTAVTMEQ